MNPRNCDTDKEAMSKEAEKLINAFERKILKQILGLGEG